MPFGVAVFRTLKASSLCSKNNQKRIDEDAGEWQKDLHLTSCTFMKRNVGQRPQQE